MSIARAFTTVDLARIQEIKLKALRIAHMTKVAVTGGAGFIGSNLTRRLLSEGHEVVVIDDLSTGLLANIDQNNSIFYQISITDRKSLATALKGCDTIFHLAARGSVPRSIKNPVATHEVNATGTLNVLEVARITGAHVIFSSSSSVYGRNMRLPKDELMWLGPMTPYAASKLAAEGYVQAYASAYNIPVTLLRFFNVFGPRQRPDHEYAAVLPKWIWLAMHGNPIDVYGDGNASRDFTYVDTVLDVAMMAMTKKITTDGAINLAFGNRIFLNDVIEILKKYFPDLQVNYKKNRLGDVKESQNAPELLKTLFPAISPEPFKDALAETIVWLKEFGESVANGPQTLD
jgi:UDP-glucose 4-epimerase